jgi:cell division protein FtsQ
MKIRRIKDVQVPLHKKNKRKRKIKRILRFINTLLVTALFVTTIVYTAMSPYFYIKNIDAYASEHYDSKTLTAISGISIGENGFRLLFKEPGKFFMLRIGSSERRIIESCPYVKSAKVRYIIPSTVRIEVSERLPAALLRLEGTSFIIDKEGYMLELNPQQEMASIPVFKGIEPDSYALGTRITNDEQKLLTAFNVYDYLKQIDEGTADKLLPGVDYIDVGDPGNISLSLESRIIANLGKAEELNYKINAIKAIMANNIKKDERGKLDFSSDENIVFTPENGG